MDNSKLLEWLKTLPWYYSTILGILYGAFQILYPVYQQGQPLTLNMVIGAIVSVIVGILIPQGVKQIPNGK